MEHVLQSTPAERLGSSGDAVIGDDLRRGGELTASRTASGTLAARRRLLQKSPLFQSFAEAELDLIASCSSERPMSRGETLMRTGDPGLSMMAIVTGQVRVMLAGSQGRDQIISVLGPGAIFGELSLFDNNPRSADVVAVTTGRLLVIERSGVQALAASEPRFAWRLIEILCGRLRSTISQLDSLLFEDVSTRIEHALLKLAAGTAPRHVDITQVALGQMVGACREMVNRRLGALAADGVVALSPGRIVLLDETRLSESGSGAVSRV